MLAPTPAIIYVGGGGVLAIQCTEPVVGQHNTNGAVTGTRRLVMGAKRVGLGMLVVLTLIFHQILNWEIFLILKIFVYIYLAKDEYE